MTTATNTDNQTGPSTIKSAFGAENRARLINAYFTAHGTSSLDPAQAWSHVYRLLLWTDQTEVPPKFRLPRVT